MTEDRQEDRFWIFVMSQKSNQLSAVRIGRDEEED
jgi:hypothetical protein